MGSTTINYTDIIWIAGRNYLLGLFHFIELDDRMKARKFITKEFGQFYFKSVILFGFLLFAYIINNKVVYCCFFIAQT